MQTRTELVPRTAPIALWRVAEAFLHVLHGLFGAPKEVAAQHTLTRKAHTLMSSWLRAGEAMLRRLLMIEAAAIEVSVQSAPGAGKRARTRVLHAASADEPDSWRVSFRCAFDRRRPRRRGAVCPRRETRFLSAWPLAERYEAMLRVFNAPFACARRLARRLRAKRGLAAIMLRAPPEYGHRVDRADEITEAARRAWNGPDSS